LGADEREKGNRMRAVIFAAALAAMGIPALNTAAQPADTGKGEARAPGLDKADAKFLNDAAAGGLLEVTLGQMAAKQASNDEVKKFGQRMFEDHSKLNDQLHKVAQQKNVALPKALSKTHQTEADKLSKLTGVAFDKAYMQHMVDEHDKDVKEFKARAADAKDPDVKNLAATAVPTLEEHLRLARDLHSRITQPAKKP